MKMFSSALLCTFCFLLIAPATKAAEGEVLGMVCREESHWMSQAFSGFLSQSYSINANTTKNKVTVLWEGSFRKRAKKKQANGGYSYQNVDTDKLASEKYQAISKIVNDITDVHYYAQKGDLVLLKISETKSSAHYIIVDPTCVSTTSLDLVTLSLAAAKAEMTISFKTTSDKNSIIDSQTKKPRNVDEKIQVLEGAKGFDKTI